MKRIFGIMAILLIWTGSVNAGVLKVMIPVDEFEKLESRLETLEKENSQLKSGAEFQPIKPPKADRASYAKEMQARIEALERENNQLRKEVLKPLPAVSLEAEKASAAARELEVQLNNLEQENNLLKQQVESLAGESSEEAAAAKGMDTQLEALGRENRQLKRSVASLKEAGTVLRSDKRTARHVYSETNKKIASHVFK
ncbi:MAG: hypothetical protein KAS94_02085 [Desulfobulbaceae bacterium]|nr:hypothetical protein [Desulfobulbaceae bacterium]